MKILYIIGFWGLLSFLEACNVINPAEEIPTYIRIDSVKLIPTNSAKHGSVSQKITDVWVYYNRDLVGPFELPARVPILAKDRGQIQVLAGVYENGLSGTRSSYPFYTVDTFTFNANPGQEITHIPLFNYRTADTPAVTYHKEDFEQGNIFLKRYNNDTTLVRTNLASEKFEEDWSGIIHFKDTIDNAECITAQSYYLPVNRSSYMELNYKCDIPFVIRLEALSLGTYYNSDIIGLKATNAWTKVYLKLDGFANTFQNAPFKFVIKAEKPSNMNEAKILIDNFKIIYFN